MPSRIHLYRGEDKPATHSHIRRIRKATEPRPSQGVQRNITGTLLSRVQLEGFLKLRGGQRVSEWMTRRRTFGKRLIAAYVTAGSACVEQKPALAFLLFAVALESVILGDRKTEITFQLSVRVAHLLGKTAERRKYYAAQVKKLYGIRSAIAHAGENDVAESDLEEIRVMCLTCLYILTKSPDFAATENETDLDEWFLSKLLGGT